MNHYAGKTLPATIGNWTQLQSFSLSFADLTTLPDQAGNWSELETLELRRVTLECIPSTMSQYPKLRNVAVYTDKEQFQTWYPHISNMR